MISAFSLVAIVVSQDTYIAGGSNARLGKY